MNSCIHVRSLVTYQQITLHPSLQVWTMFEWLGSRFANRSNAKFKARLWYQDQHITPHCPKYSITIRDMIGNVYMRGIWSFCIHVKPSVNLYKYHIKARTLLILYISHVTRVHNTVPHSIKNKVYISPTSHYKDVQYNYITITQKDTTMEHTASQKR